MRLLYDDGQIREAVRRIARAVEEDHGGQEVHLLGILKGSFLFVADLARELKLPCTLDFVRLSSYGAATSSSGRVEERLAKRDTVTGRRVLIVDEIVDSGRTLARLLADLAAEKPLSLRVCALVDKTGRREVEVPVHYRGFALDDGFLVGYGLDWDERYRNLDSIHVMEAEETSTISQEKAMAIWCCPTCGYEKDARCKPKNCPECDKPVAFGKKEEAPAPKASACACSCGAKAAKPAAKAAAKPAAPKSAPKKK